MISINMFSIIVIIFFSSTLVFSNVIFQNSYSEIAYSEGYSFKFDKSNYDLGDTVKVSIMYWNYIANSSSSKDEVTVSVIGPNLPINYQIEKIVLKKNIPYDYSFKIGTDFKPGKYKIHLSDLNFTLNGEHIVTLNGGTIQVGPYDNVDPKPIESNQLNHQSSNISYKITNGIEYEYRGLDPKGDPLWVETDNNYFNRIMMPLIFNIVLIGVIITIIVIVIYTIKKQNKVKKLEKHKKFESEQKKSDEIQKLKDRIDELEKSKDSET